MTLLYSFHLAQCFVVSSVHLKSNFSNVHNFWKVDMASVMLNANAAVFFPRQKSIAFQSTLRFRSVDQEES